MPLYILIRCDVKKLEQEPDKMKKIREQRRKNYGELSEKDEEWISEDSLKRAIYCMIQKWIWGDDLWTCAVSP